jgi:molecular chaperone GrpE
MAVVQVVREMLGVLDNYDRAFGALKAETEEQKKIEAAFRETYAEILQVFTDLGVKTVDSVGTEFDYAVHQAVMQKPSADYEEGIVCEEFAKGFIMGDTLIRAAMVAVAA